MNKILQFRLTLYSPYLKTEIVNLLTKNEEKNTTKTTQTNTKKVNN